MTELPGHGHLLSPPAPSTTQVGMSSIHYHHLELEPTEPYLVPPDGCLALLLEQALLKPNRRP